jgi:23S rRNA pseudouridine1911/1915/1917 synthase
MESSEDLADGFASSDPQLAFLIDEKHVGVRLDQYLALQLPDLSRSQISASIRGKTILVNSVSRKNSYRLKREDAISGAIEEDKPLVVQAEEIDFSILFEDDWLLFICKPPELVVHPGAGNHTGTLVNGLVHHCSNIAGVGDSVRPGIVHRLDKDTSGVMVVAKTDGVHRDLVNCFKEHRLEKEYLTLVQGIPKQYSGRVVGSIGRHHIHRQKMAVKEFGGKHAATNWELLECYVGGLSLLRVRIETGRTHQIRVHMAHLGLPVAGDTVYGGGKSKIHYPRQMLHASRLILEHPVTGRKMDVKAPLWDDFQSILDGLEPVTEDNW